MALTSANPKILLCGKFSGNLSIFLIHCISLSHKILAFVQEQNRGPGVSIARMQKEQSNVMLKISQVFRACCQESKYCLIIYIKVREVLCSKLLATLRCIYLSIDNSSYTDVHSQNN